MPCHNNITVEEPMKGYLRLTWTCLYQVDSLKEIYLITLAFVYLLDSSGIILTQTHSDLKSVMKLFHFNKLSRQKNASTTLEVHGIFISFSKTGCHPHQLLLLHSTSAEDHPVSPECSVRGIMISANFALLGIHRKSKNGACVNYEQKKTLLQEAPILLQRIIGISQAFYIIKR